MNQTNAILVRRDSTKFMLAVRDVLTSWEMIYTQVLSEKRCLKFDFLLFVWFVGKKPFLYYYICLIFFLHKAVNDCFFLGQQTCVYEKITTSICFENWFRKFSKVVDTFVNISRSAKNNLSLKLCQFLIKC